jgi:hypothetical protein
MLGLPAPVKWGPFVVVKTDNGTNLDYMDTDGEITSQHYAFLVDEPNFDAIFARIRARNLPYWADPDQTQQGQINPHDGGCGLYFEERTGTSSKSSPVPTAAAGGIPERMWQSQPHSDLAISSVIFLASPSTIMVLSR